MRGNRRSAGTSSHAGWKEQAACRGPELDYFFPPTRGERRDEKALREARAKAICQSCSVRVHCLDFATSEGELHGIWGGMTESERLALSPVRVG